MKLRRLAVGATLVIATAACGTMTSNRTVPPTPGQFRLDEWSITADQPVMKPGGQTITATNVGHHTHELVIVRGTDAASLPTKSDGSVDEAQLARVEVGEIADVPAGTSRHQVFDLRPGSYVAFCNIVGGTDMGSGMMGGMAHVHFAAGMHVEFTVAE